jgi:hypothetical protein
MVKLLLGVSNKKPNDVYQIAAVGGAMIVDENGVKVRFPVALCFDDSAFRKDISNKM